MCCEVFGFLRFFRFTSNLERSFGGPSKVSAPSRHNSVVNACSDSAVTVQSAEACDVGDANGSDIGLCCTRIENCHGETQENSLTEEQAQIDQPSAHERYPTLLDLKLALVDSGIDLASFLHLQSNTLLTFVKMTSEANATVMLCVQYFQLLARWSSFVFSSGF